MQLVDKQISMQILAEMAQKQESFIEFDSMINIRPSKGNRSRGVDDPKIQEIIKKIVHCLVTA